jgi:hypothetical protein
MRPGDGSQRSLALVRALEGLFDPKASTLDERSHELLEDRHDLRGAGQGDARCAADGIGERCGIWSANVGVSLERVGDQRQERYWHVPASTRFERRNLAIEDVLDHFDIVIVIEEMRSRERFPEQNAHGEYVGGRTDGDRVDSSAELFGCLIGEPLVARTNRARATRG